MFMNKAVSVAGVVIAVGLLAGCGSATSAGDVALQPSTSASSPNDVAASQSYLASFVGLSVGAATEQAEADGWRVDLARPGWLIPGSYDAQRIILILDSSDVVVSARNS